MSTGSSVDNRQGPGDKRDAFSGIWAEACRRYQANPGKKMHPQTFPNSVQELVRDVDSNNHKFSTFRERSHTLFTVLNAIGQPLQAFSDLAGGAASSAFPPAATIFGAIRSLVDAANGVSASLDAISELLQAQRDFVTRFKIYLGADGSPADLTVGLRGKVIEVLATVLDITAVATKAIGDGRAGRFKAFGKNIVLGQDTKVQDLLKRLDRLTTSEHQLVSAENFAQTRLLSHTVKDMHSDIKQNAVQMDNLSLNAQNLDKRVTQMLDAIEMSRESNLQQRDESLTEHIKNVLKPLPFSQDRHEAIKRERIPSVGDWIRKEQPVRDWVEGNIHDIWITGTAGCGKSYLAANTFDFLQQHLAAAVKTKRAFRMLHSAIYFFQDNKDETKSLAQALKDIAYQFTKQDIAYGKYVASRCQSISDIASLDSIWRKLFVDYFVVKGNHSDSIAYIILDALDESNQEERVSFFELLADLRDNQKCNIRLAMVGRLHVEQEIENAVGALVSVHVNWTKNTDDISHYVRTGIKKSRVLNRLSEALKETMELELTSKAGGMFMWVKLMMSDLVQVAKSGRESAVRQALNKAPRGLNPMLRHVFAGYNQVLSPEEILDLNDMLAWVLLAKRPLTLQELDFILRLKTPEHEPVIDLEGKLRIQFGSLFSLSREDGLTTADLLAAKYGLIQLPGDKLNEAVGAYDEGKHDVSTETSLNVIATEVDDDYDEIDNSDFSFKSNSETTYVAFAHASIADYLFQHSDFETGSKEKTPTTVVIDVDKMRIKIATTCLTLIETLSRCEEPRQSEDSPAVVLKHYVSSNWYRHVLDVSSTEVNHKFGTGFAEMLGRTFTDVDRLSVWAGKYPSELITSENGGLFRRVLHTGVQELPHDMAKWLESTAENKLTVFEPCVRYSALFWLTGKPLRFKRDVAARCMQAVHAYITRQDHNSAPQQLPSIWEAEQVLTAAAWARLEQDSLWDARVAAVLVHCQLYEPAQTHFQLSLDKDAKLWDSKLGLALSAFRLRDYSSVLRILKERPDLTEDGPLWSKESRVYIWYQLTGHCYRLMADEQAILQKLPDAWALQAQASEAFQKGASYEHYPDDNLLGFYIITAYRLARSVEIATQTNKTSRPNGFAPSTYQDIVDVLRNLSDVKDKGPEGTDPIPDCCKLTAFLRRDTTSFFLIGAASAARKTGELAWLAEQYELAIMSAERDLRPALASNLRLNLATIYSCDRRYHDKALDIWSGFWADRRLTAFHGVNTRHSLRTVIAAIGQFCVKRALEASTTSKQNFISILERLINSVTHDFTVEGVTDVSFQPRLLESCLTRWYFNEGQKEKAHAFIRPYIAEGLAILSDDDRQNDWIGFEIIMHASAAVQDDANHLAALYTTLLLPSFSSRWLDCSGCFRRLSYELDVFMCRVCSCTAFCEDCHELLKTDRLFDPTEDECDTHHDFLHVPLITESDLPREGNILVSGHKISMEEWKSNLRQQWRI